MPSARRSLSGTLRLDRLATAALLVLLCGLAHPAPDGAAARFYEDALARYERQDLAGAIVQLKNALQIDKNMLPVQVLLGKALLQNGEAIPAEVALTEALRLGVSRAEVVLPLMQANLAQGKQKAALELPLFNPDGLPLAVQAQLQLLRASAYADVGDARNAMRAIDEARVIEPKLPQTWLAEVPIRVRARQFREAAAAVAKALSLAPDLPEALYQQGTISHVQGDLRGALAGYDKALAADPAHIEARVARAGLRIDLGQADEAQKDVAELRRLSPREPRGAYLQALLAERSGDAAAARDALNEVTALIDPVPIDFIRFRPQLLMLDGMAHFGLGEREKAKPYFELFQKVHGTSAASKVLAQILLSEGNVARAIEVLDGYLRAQPADSQALALLASAHMSQGRNAQAAAMMQEALKTRETPELHTVLGLSLVGGGQSGSGMRELEAAFAKDPNQTPAGAALVGLYLRTRQAGKAVTVAETLVKQRPTNAGFHNLLGMARAQTGNLALARASFEQALKLDDGLAPAKLNLARLDMAAQAYDAAQVRLEGLLKKSDKNIDALMEMANLARLRSQPADAVRWLEKANAVAGAREFRPALALIDFHLGSRQFDRALDVSKRLLGKAPDDLTALLAHARAQIANGDRFAARSTLNNATRLAAFDAAQQVQIATLQLFAENPSGASYSLEKGLSSRPDHLPSLALLTELDLRQGDAAKAEKRARQMVDMKPKSAVGHGLTGDIAMSRGQTAVAVDAYRRAHQVEPSSLTLLKLFGAMSSQDLGKATQTGEQWLKQHPNDVAVRKVMADHHARSGNFPIARTSYDNILKVAPDDPETLNNLANVLLRLKDPGALAMAERAVARNPSNPVVLDTLGWALFQNGEVERALQVLRDARLRAPDNADIHYHLGAVLAKSGRPTQAREELEAALKPGKPFENAKDAESLLRTLR